MAYFVPNKYIYIDIFSRFKHVMRTERKMSLKRKSSSTILNTFIIIAFAFCCYLTKQVRSMVITILDLSDFIDSNIIISRLPICTNSIRNMRDSRFILKT